jgi:hypothetical protein
MESLDLWHRAGAARNGTRETLLNLALESPAVIRPDGAKADEAPTDARRTARYSAMDCIFAGLGGRQIVKERPLFGSSGAADLGSLFFPCRKGRRSSGQMKISLYKPNALCTLLRELHQLRTCELPKKSLRLCLLSFHMSFAQHTEAHSTVFLCLL